MLGQSEINFRQFGTHFGGNRLPSNDIEAGFHPFRSQELIQEVTLKLQPESTWKSQSSTAAGYVMISFDQFTEQRSMKAFWMDLTIQHGHLQALNSTHKWTGLLERAMRFKIVTQKKNNRTRKIDHDHIHSPRSCVREREDWCRDGTRWAEQRRPRSAKAQSPVDTFLCSPELFFSLSPFFLYSSPKAGWRVMMTNYSARACIMCVRWEGMKNGVQHVCAVCISSTRLY